MKFRSLAVVGTLLAAALIPVVGATAASAHTPKASATCEALTVNATSYDGTKPGSPAVFEEQLITPAVEYQPAVYGEPELISEAVEYQPAVYEIEYQFVHKWDVLHLNPKWKTEGNPNSHGWHATGNTRNGKLISAEVPARDAVYGPPVLISAEVPAQDAVYGMVEVAPEVPADTSPNAITIEINDVIVVDTTFGTSFHDVISFDSKYVANEWKVRIRAWNDPTGSEGWSKNITGTTTPCEEPLIPVTPATPTVVDECGPGNLTVTTPDIEGVTYTQNTIGGLTKVSATANEGYVLEGTSSWSFRESNFDECPVVTPPQPEDEVTVGEWSKPVITCDSKVGDEVAVKREVTTTAYVLVEGEWVLDTENSTTVTEEDTYTVIQEDIDALKCTVVTPPTEDPKPVVKAPAPSGDSTLAQTGGEIAGWAVGGSLAALIAGSLLFARRRHA